MTKFRGDCGRRNYVILKCCVIFSVCTCISGEFHGNFSRYVNRSRIAKSTNHHTFLKVILRSRSKIVFQGLESKLDEQDVVIVQDKNKNGDCSRLLQKEKKKKTHDRFSSQILERGLMEETSRIQTRREVFILLCYIYLRTQSDQEFYFSRKE